MPDPRPTIVLVHGAWHGSWVWETVAPRLSLRWPVRTVELPTTAAENPGDFGLYDDAEVVRRCVLDVAGPVVVVAHSYGGAVVSQGVADLPGVRHIVYVCAFQLDIGESLLGVIGGKPLPWWVLDGHVMTVADPEVQFFNDLHPDTARRASARLNPFSYRAVTQALTSAAWRSVPSTYIVCEKDPFGAAQEVFAARATHVRRLASGHSPFLSVPSGLCHLIEEAAASGDTV